MNSQALEDKPEGEFDLKNGGRIAFAEDVNQPRNSSRALYVPPPRERDQDMRSGVCPGTHFEARIDRNTGCPIVEKDSVPSDDGMLPESIHLLCLRSRFPLTPLNYVDEDGMKLVDYQAGLSSLNRRLTYQFHRLGLSTTKCIENMASSMFILGASKSQENPDTGSHYLHVLLICRTCLRG